MPPKKATAVADLNLFSSARDELPRAPGEYVIHTF